MQKTLLRLLGLMNEVSQQLILHLRVELVQVFEAFFYLKDLASSRQRCLSDFDRVRVGETLHVIATR